jgi:hypothetical protein
MPNLKPHQLIAGIALQQGFATPNHDAARPDICLRLFQSHGISPDLRGPVQPGSAKGHCLRNLHAPLPFRVSLALLGGANNPECIPSPKIY